MTFCEFPATGPGPANAQPPYQSTLAAAITACSSTSPVFRRSRWFIIARCVSAAALASDNVLPEPTITPLDSGLLKVHLGLRHDSAP